MCSTWTYDHCSHDSRCTISRCTNLQAAALSLQHSPAKSSNRANASKRGILERPRARPPTRTPAVVEKKRDHKYRNIYAINNSGQDRENICMYVRFEIIRPMLILMRLKATPGKAVETLGSDHPENCGAKAAGTRPLCLEAPLPACTCRYQHRYGIHGMRWAYSILTVAQYKSSAPRDFECALARLQACKLCWIARSRV